MSHAENKVKWCLKKAEREIMDGKKHRGLVKKEGDIEEIRRYILKAEHNFLAISYFNKGGFSDWSMSAVFYCIYHCFLAIIKKFGYESRNQECTIALIKYLKESEKINLDDKFVEAFGVYDEKERQESSIIEKREFYTYGTTTTAEDREAIEKAIELCKECLDKTKQIVFER